MYHSVQALTVKAREDNMQMPCIVICARVDKISAGCTRFLEGALTNQILPRPHFSLPLSAVFAYLLVRKGNDSPPCF